MKKNLSKNNIQLDEHKYFITLVVFFFTVLFVNNVVVYKLVDVGDITMSAASIIFPLTYWITDITTEVYGYRLTRKLIWLTTIFNVVFAVLITILLNLPSPSTWKMGAAFHGVFKNLLFVCVMHVIASPVSYFLNAYLISKWKILVKGKYFWLRSIGSTMIGEIIFSIIMTSVTWHSNQSISIYNLIFITYLTKVLWAIIGAYPATLMVHILKRKEGVDVYDYNVIFNPFSSK